MTVLAQADIDAILGFVGEAASGDGPDPVSPHALRGLRDLVGADIVLFSELDRVRQRTIGLTTIDGVVPIDGEDDPNGLTYWQIREDHPVCGYNERTRDWRTLRVADFMGRRQLHESRVYWEWFKPLGIETEMCAGLDAPMWHTKDFLFRRVSGDFSERDRNVIEAVRPIPARLYDARLSRQRLAAALQLMGDRDGAGAAAVVILDGAGAPDFLSESARAMFTRLGAAPGRLPAKLGVHTRTAAVARLPTLAPARPT